MAILRTEAKWEGLTPSYRSRLVRGGITREAYLRGDPLKAARGHRATPEKPSEAERHPERYSAYRERLEKRRESDRKRREKRDKLVGQIFDLKERLYGSTDKWNPVSARKSIREDTKTHRERGIRELESALAEIKQWVPGTDDYDPDAELEYWSDRDYDDDSPYFYH